MTDTKEKSAGWWYARYDDAEMWEGPHDTREAAVEAGWSEWPEGDFYVCQCFQAPLDFARWAGIDDLFDRAEEAILDSDRINTEFEEGPFFDVGPELEKDLIARLKATVAAWQKDHGLEFTCGTFSRMSNPERIQ